MVDQVEGARGETLTLGQYLRQTREAQQRTVDAVADALHITPTYVNFIEKDLFNKLPGAIFARGYIKSYARLLNLPIDAVMERYFEQTGDVLTEFQVQPASNEYGASMRRHAVKLAFMAVLLVVMVPVFIWWAAHREDIDGDLQDTLVLNVPAVAESDNASTATPTTVAVEVNSTPEPAVENAISPTPVAIAEPEQAKLLEISVAEKSWVQVKSIQGNVVHDAEHEAGERIGIDGKPPFYVWIKNGKSASVTYKGEPVTITNIDSKGAARLVVGK